MLYYEGLSCPVCGIAFSAEDDVVVCPKCGLPHHRACWKQVGHCYEMDKHDTPEQWSRDRASASSAPSAPEAGHICPHCGTANTEYAEFCMRCGAQLPATEWHSASQTPPPVKEYTPLGQSSPDFAPDERIGANNAAELAAFVGNNGPYYIERFRRISQGKAGGWNWAAFLLGPIWLFYRKQYALGSLFMILQVMLDITAAVAYMPVDTANLTEEAMMALMGDPVFMIAAIFSYVVLALRIILGIRANHFYLHLCEKKIGDAKKTVPDASASELTALGGVSAGVAAIVALLIYSVLPVLIDMVIQFVSMIPG